MPWRQPDVVNPPLLELADVLLEADPVLLVGGNVPLEALHHGHVFGSGLPGFRGVGHAGVGGVLTHDVEKRGDGVEEGSSQFGG